MCKVLIADTLGEVANAVFDANVNTLSAAQVWLGALTYSMQIYFDFSGYSDMAIGLGLMMGFTFPENFNRPCVARSFTDFWRRWHITLSSWMREYLYIPMGGNRVSTWRRYLNLWTVFFLSGLWHGPNWTFVVWGLYHGLFLVFDKLIWLRVGQNVFVPARVALTFLLVMIGWIFFRADSLTHAFALLEVMFSFKGQADPTGLLVQDMISHRGIFILLLAGMVSFLPDLSRAETDLVKPFRLAPTLRGICACVLLFLCAASLVNSVFHPFIYFKF